MATGSNKTKARAAAASEDTVRITVPVLPETHMAYSILCVDLDMGMSDRLLQLLKACMDGKITLEGHVKPNSKCDTHTKRVGGNAPKPDHMMIRKFCIKNGYLLTDLAERLIVWDVQNQGALLEPES